MILVVCVGIASLIALYVTIVRITTGYKFVSYDAWILSLFIAIALQLYDNHYP